jgi:hypothetical protein
MKEEERERKGIRRERAENFGKQASFHDKMKFRLFRTIEESREK